MNLLPRRSVAVAAAGLLGVVLAGCAPSPTPTENRVSVTAPSAAVNATPCTIQTGDTLYSIAEKQGVSWRDLVEANPNVDWQGLRSGQIILVPGGRTSVPVRVPGPVAPRPSTLGMNPGHPGPITAEDHFVWPLRGQVLAGFRQPVSWRMREPNMGVDIAAEAGAEVVAAKSGRVNTFTHAEDDGQTVILEHSDGTATSYSHLGEILVKHGTWVRQGEAIGTAGSSGRAHGTELCFRVLENNHFVDPLPLLR